jgi:O-antigen/teichoic acid export membrane protein
MGSLANRLRREVESNLATSLGLTVVTRGAQLVMAGALIRGLGLERYGFWSLVMAVVASQTFVGLGIDGAIQREFGRLREAASPRSVRKGYRRATLVYLAIASAALAAATAMASLGSLKTISPDFQTQLFFALSCALAFGFSNNISLESGALTGLGKYRWNANIQMVAAIALASGYLASGRLRSDITWAIAWYALIRAIQFVVSRYAVKYLLDRVAIGSNGAEDVTDRDALLRFAALSGAFQISALSDYVLFLAPRFVLAGAIGLRGVALFDIGIKLGQIAAVPATLVLPGLLAALVAARTQKGLVDGLYWSVTRILVFLAAVGAVTAWIGCSLLVRVIIGSVISASELSAVRWLTLAVVAQTLSGPAIELAAVYDRPRVMVKFKIAMCLAVVGSLVFAPMFGLTGMAIALTAVLGIGGLLLLLRFPASVGLAANQKVVVRALSPACVILVLGTTLGFGFIQHQISDLQTAILLVAVIVMCGLIGIAFGLHREFRVLEDRHTGSD